MLYLRLPIGNISPLVIQASYKAAPESILVKYSNEGFLLACRTPSLRSAETTTRGGNLPASQAGLIWLSISLVVHVTTPFQLVVAVGQENISFCLPASSERSILPEIRKISSIEGDAAEAALGPCHRKNSEPLRYASPLPECYAPGERSIFRLDQEKIQ